MQFIQLQITILVVLVQMSTAADPIKVLIMSDAHVLKDFSPTSFDCMPHNPLTEPFYKSRTYYPFGHYYCKTPFKLVQSALMKMKELVPNPHLILFCGDFIDPRHNLHTALDYLYPNSLLRVIKGIIKEITEQFLKVFPDTAVGFTPGNHDKLSGSEVPIPWLYFKKEEYSFLYDLWLKNYTPNNKWATKENEETMLDGGYWKLDLDIVRVLSVNSNYFWSHDYSSDKSCRDPKARERQLVWLESNLEECSKIKKRVIIVAHIPFHVTAYKEELGELTWKYRDILSIIICGHMHPLHLYVSSDNSSSIPYYNELAAQALTTQEESAAPGFSILHFDPNIIPIKLEQYGFQLGRTFNRSLSISESMKFWKRTFDSEEDLGMKSLSAEGIYEFNERLSKDKNLEFKLYYFVHNHIPFKDKSFEDIGGERGYLGIEGADIRLFYWLLRAEINPNYKPLVILFEGGPGCGGELHLLNAIGPNLLKTGHKGIQLENNPHTWVALVNLLIIDQPLGATLSGVLNDDYMPSTISELTTQLGQFFKSFYTTYPEFQHRNTYIIAHDFAFHYIQSFLDQIHKSTLPMEVAGFSLISPIIWGAKQGGGGLVNSALQQGLLTNLGLKYITAQLGSTVASVFDKLGFGGSAHFAFKLIENIVIGVNSSNLNDHGLRNILLDPNVENMLNIYMTQEILKTDLSMPYMYTRCNPYVSQRFEKEIQENYSTQLKQILKLNLPISIVFGENDLWANEKSLMSIFYFLDSKYYQEFLNKEWSDWKIEGKKEGEIKKVGKLTIFKVLGAGTYPLIDNQKMGFDILANLLFSSQY